MNDPQLLLVYLWPIKYLFLKNCNKTLAAIIDLVLFIMDCWNITLIKYW